MIRFSERRGGGEFAYSEVRVVHQVEKTLTLFMIINENVGEQRLGILLICCWINLEKIFLSIPIQSIRRIFKIQYISEVPSNEHISICAISRQ